jgi:hypothetical protein
MAYNYNINGNGRTKNSVINKHKGEGMEEKVVVEFINDMKQTHVDLEIPLEITANDLVLALNEAYGLVMDTDNIFSCYQYKVIVSNRTVYKEFEIAA